MGNLMTFHAARAPEAALVLERGEEVRAIALATADFSLHIGHDELDELVAAACEQQKTARIAWEEALAHEPISDEAFKMSPTFVELFAGLSAPDFVPTARAWLGDTLTPDFEKAISELVDVCRCARSQQLDVVFVCYP